MPRHLPQQECPRCDNLFPGGLKRCTACGLEIARAYGTPDAASPWIGFERGVIECNSCGYATPDVQARKGRIQKCGQCAKVLYIPSGLYRIMPARHDGTHKANVNPRYKARRAFSWSITDRVGAGLSRFSRSKARLPMALLIILLGAGFLFGLNQIKNQIPTVPEKPSELKLYYDKAFVINKNFKIAEEEFDRGAGGKPIAVAEYTDRITPNNRTRFVRASDRMLKQVETYLAESYSMVAAIPAGAESHYARLKVMLEEQQRYYARLKDGVDGKNEARWKEAFAAVNIIRETRANEEQALNQLQALVLRPPAATVKA